MKRLYIGWIDLCKLVSSKYSCQVREALPKEYSYIIDELLLV